jgi:hypothetical protein
MAWNKAFSAVKYVVRSMVSSHPQASLFDKVPSNLREIKFAVN